MMISAQHVIRPFPIACRVAYFMNTLMLLKSLVGSTGNCMMPTRVLTLGEPRAD
jgi:hypothetical protein